MSSKRLIVVSNRLPITVSQDPEGKWVFKESSGGLVSALSGLKKEMGFIWVGWPGFASCVIFEPRSRDSAEREGGL